MKAFNKNKNFKLIFYLRPGSRREWLIFILNVPLKNRVSAQLRNFCDFGIGKHKVLIILKTHIFFSSSKLYEDVILGCPWCSNAIILAQDAALYLFEH